MPFCFRVSCELCAIGQSFNFDAPEETFGNLVDAIQGDGWKLRRNLKEEPGIGGIRYRTVCSAHTDAEAEAHFQSEEAKP